MRSAAPQTALWESTGPRFEPGTVSPEAVTTTNTSPALQQKVTVPSAHLFSRLNVSDGPVVGLVPAASHQPAGQPLHLGPGQGQLQRHQYLLDILSRGTG